MNASTRFLRITARLMLPDAQQDDVEYIFDERGGLIGHDAECELALLHAQGGISRVHGQIRWENDAFQLINLSRNQPIALETHHLPPGAKSAIRHDQQCALGNYLLIVELSHPADVPAAPVAPAPVIEAVCVLNDIEETQEVEEAPPQAAGNVDAPSQVQEASLTETPETPVETGVDRLPPVPIEEPASSHTLPEEPLIPEGVFDDLLGPTTPQATVSIASGAQHTESAALLDSGPFADLLKDQPRVTMADAPAANQSAFPTQELIPEDFNPLAFGGVSVRNTDDPLKEIQALANEKEVWPERSVDAIFQPGDAPISNLTRDVLDTAAHSGLTDTHARLDPLQLFSDSSETSPIGEIADMDPSVASGTTMGDHRSELGSYFRAPRALSEAPPSTPTVTKELEQELEQEREEKSLPSPAQPVIPSMEPALPEATRAQTSEAATTTSPAENTLLDAFRSGAQLTDEHAPFELTPKILHALGEMLRETVQGCIDLTQSRPANATGKLPPGQGTDAAHVLSQLLASVVDDSITGTEAIQNAFHDMRVSTQAQHTTAHSRRAALLEELAPSAILEHAGVQLGTSPFASPHRARILWSIYCDRHAALCHQLRSN